MKNNEKKLSLIKHGLSVSLVTNLNENQVNVLYKRLLEQSTPQNTTKVDKVVTTYKVEPGKKTMINGVEIDTTGGQTKVTPMKETEDVELNEKSVSKQQQKFFGVVRAMQKGDIPKKGKAGEAAKEMSQKDVEDFASTKHKGLPKKKETKENYLDMVGKAYNKGISNKLSDVNVGLKYESDLEKDITEIVESALHPKMTKKDLLNLIRENNPSTIEPEIEQEPITKPLPTINPDFDPFKDPDPSDDPEAKGDNFKWFMSKVKETGLIK